MTTCRSSVTAPSVRLAGVLRQAFVTLLQGLLEVVHHGDVPGYSQLPWPTRCQINMRALLIFVCSRSCVRLTAWLIVWLLGSHLLIWQYDLHGPIAAMLPVLALLWVMPWFAHARRNAVARLLRHRWPG